MMALTATATRTLRCDVCHVLEMKDPHIVTVSPDKSNVILQISPFESCENAFKPLIDKLKIERLNMGRTIHARLYLFFHLALKSELTEPMGYPDLPHHRHVHQWNSSFCKGCDYVLFYKASY